MMPVIKHPPVQTLVLYGMMKPFADKVNKLAELKSRFDAVASHQKILILEMLSRHQPDSAKSLLLYHEILLFFSAFPDSGKLAEKARAELLRLKNFLLIHGRKKAFLNSGIECTLLKWKPSVDALLWMFDNSNDLHYTVKQRKKMEELTAMLCFKTEWDSLLDPALPFHRWLKQSGGGNENNSSHVLESWLVRLKKLTKTPAVRDFLFDALSLTATCTLTNNRSLTFNRLFVSNPFFYQQKPEWKENEKLKPVSLNEKTSLRILDSIKAALFARQKETDPVTYADHRFLEAFETEDGFTVYLLSMKPEYRLPLESYIGYMVYSNGIPVCYGGGWIFYERCEFGINIFEQFRGGPSARILNVLMNVYRHSYGIKTFIIPPYQFGEGNKDGIKTAAFWFYYKAGFRPVDKTLNRLAVKEWKKIQSGKGCRTPEKTLIRFTESPLQWTDKTKKIKAPDLISLSHAAIKYASKNFSGNMQKASQRSAAQLLKRSRLTYKGWTETEKSFFEELSPFVCMTPDWEQWSVKELQQAVALLKEKANNEHRFIRLLPKHKRWREGLWNMR